MNLNSDFLYRSRRTPRREPHVAGLFLEWGSPINLLVDTIFANARSCRKESLVSLYVADRVTELVWEAMHCRSHRHSADDGAPSFRGDHEAMKKTFGFALRIVSFITIPAAVGLVILREPIVQVLFQHGLFVAESTRLTARALLYYSMGLSRVCDGETDRAGVLFDPGYAHPRARGRLTLLVNVLLNVIFLFYFFPKLRNGGPASGQRAGQLFQRVGAIYGFPFAVRTARDMDIFGIHGKDRYLFCGDGRYMLDDAAVFSFRFDRHFLTRLVIFIGMIGGATLA